MVVDCVACVHDGADNELGTEGARELVPALMKLGQLRILNLECAWHECVGQCVACGGIQHSGGGVDGGCCVMTA